MTAGPAAVRALAFSPGGKFLAAGGDDGNVRLWDVATQSQAGATMATGAPVAARVVQRERHRTLATAESDGGTELWAFATQQQTGAALPRRFRPRERAGLQPGRAASWPPATGTGPSSCGTRPAFTSPPLRSPPARRNRRPPPAVTRRPCSAPAAMSSR